MMNKSRINLVVIGHFQSGKSTLTGHLLFLLGHPAMKEANDAAEYLSIPTAKYSWLVDKLKVERQRGLTVNCSYYSCATPSRLFTVFNVPGHQKYIKNMIAATSQASCAIVTLSTFAMLQSQPSAEKQIKDHAVIAFTFGIRQLIICCNKMDEDVCNYSQVMFNQIKEKLLPLLKKIGFKEEKVSFIPVSGYLGDNLSKKSTKTTWYQGRTLRDALDLLQAPAYKTEMALRVPVLFVQKIGGIGTIVIGKVATGILYNDYLKTVPSLRQTSASSIEIHNQTVEKGKAGDFVAFNLRAVSKRDFKRGHIFGVKYKNPPRVAQSFTAQILVMDLIGTIKVGFSPVVYCHTAHVACRISQIHQLIDRSSGKQIFKNPELIKKGESATVTFVPLKPLCIEAYKDFPSLGIFIAMDNNRIVAAGIVKTVKYK